MWASRSTYEGLLSDRGPGKRRRMAKFAYRYALIGTCITLTMGVGVVGRAQQPVGFEDEAVVTPPKSRFKGTPGGSPAKLSQFGVAPGTLRSPVPVLLPSDTGLLRAMQVYADASSYSAVLPNEAFTLSIYGTRRVAVVGAKEQETEPMPQFNVERTEFGYQVSFKEFGANYMVTIECQRKVDSKCAKPSFVLGISKNMAVYVDG